MIFLLYLFIYFWLFFEIISKAWISVCIICQVDDSHEMSSLFSKKWEENIVCFSLEWPSSKKGEKKKMQENTE